MKTKILFIAAFALAGAFVSCQKEAITPGGNGDLTTNHPKGGGNDANMWVLYDVTIHLAIDTKLNGPYEVQLLNGQNNLISSQRYFKNQTVYHFKEQVRTQSGIRVARLLPASVPDRTLSNGNNLFTQPDIQLFTFEDGKCYYLNLYPQYNPPQIPH